MNPSEIVEAIVSRLAGVVPKASWGETAVFYNPDNLLPNGVYFCTIKEHDGANDKSSNLNREGIFRVAIGLSAESYGRLFGPKPARPAKGGIVNTGHDFSRVNDFMPHPIYAWMSWAQILSPTQERFAEILPFIEEAHRTAVIKFNKKTAHQSSKRTR
jgi:hypothetical protein